MSKPVVTYQNLIDAVYTYIINNCANIDAKYDSMNASFKGTYDSGSSSWIPWKSGRTLMPNADSRGDYGAWSYYELVVSTRIAQVTSSTVGTDLNNFVTNQMGASNSQTVPASDLLNAISNLTSFCIASIFFAKSPWYTNGIIYYKTASSFPGIHTRTSPTAESYLAKVADVNEIMNKITSNLKSNSYRNGNPRYTVKYINQP